MIEQLVTTQHEVEEVKNMKWEQFGLGNKKIIEDKAYEKKMVKEIDELGLNGQKKLILSKDDTIIPYPKMTEYEEKVWGMFEPTKTPIEEFSQTIIPVEILEVYKLCKTKEYFQKYEIWSEAEEEIDPILVGIRTKDKDGEDIQYSRNYETYLIARRGYALQPFQEIVSRVREEWKRRRIVRIDEGIEKLKFKRGQVENDFEQWTKGRHDSTINY